jgi:tetratricopeptide (TPR) repeat protein
MNRLVIASVAVAALAGATVLGWFEVRQAREFRRLMAVGDVALGRDQTYAAIEAYSGAITLRRDSMLGWLKRGDTYRRRGEFTPALRDLEHASRLDPMAPRPAELLGDVHAALGHQAQAAEYFTRYLSLDDRAPRVLYKLALAYYRNGDPAAAVGPLKRAVGLDHQLAEAYYLLGLCQRDTRHADDAVQSWRRAIQLNAAFVPAREELAALEIARGHRREGIEQLEALAALDGTRPDHLLDVGLTYVKGGRPDAAIATLSRAADRYPDSEDVYLALARLWLDSAEERRDPVAMSKAERALQTAAVRDNGSAELLLLRGRAQLLSGDIVTAERTLTAATGTVPVDRDAFRYLASASTRLGHADAARLAQARYDALAH